MKLALVIVTVIGLGLGCGKPDDVTVAAGGTCHLDSQLAWKHCDAKSVCLIEHDVLKLTPQPESSAPAKVIDSKDNYDKDDYDCYAAGEKCVRKGICHAKVGMGGSCGSTEMCLEGTCVGNVNADKHLVWTCSRLQ